MKIGGRWMVALAGIVLVTACGGGDSSGDGALPDEGPADLEQVEDANASGGEEGGDVDEQADDSEEVQVDGDSESGGVATAAPGDGVVTVGGTTYEFTLMTSGDIGGQDALCLADGGTFGVRAQAADGSGTYVQAVFPGDGQSARVEVNVAVQSDTATNLVAEEGFVPRVTGDEPLPPEQSSVTSVDVDVDGLSASGTAVFYDTVTEASTEGTFSFTCP